MTFEWAKNPGVTAVDISPIIGCVKDPPTEISPAVPAIDNSGVAFEDAVVNLPF